MRILVLFLYHYRLTILLKEWVIWFKYIRKETTCHQYFWSSNETEIHSVTPKSVFPYLSEFAIKARQILDRGINVLSATCRCGWRKMSSSMILLKCDRSSRRSKWRYGDHFLSVGNCNSLLSLVWLNSHVLSSDCCLLIKSEASP